MARAREEKAQGLDLLIVDPYNCIEKSKDAQRALRVDSLDLRSRKPVQKTRVLSGLLNRRSPFCNHLKHVAFSTKIKGKPPFTRQCSGVYCKDPCLFVRRRGSKQKCTGVVLASEPLIRFAREVLLLSEARTRQGYEVP